MYVVFTFHSEIGGSFDVNFFSRDIKAWGNENKNVTLSLLSG